MGIEAHNRISTPIENRNAPKNDIKPSELEKKFQSSNNDIDLSDLHEASQEFEKSIEEIGEKYGTTRKENSSGIDPSKIGFFEKFLHDDWGMRTFFALGNEIAESFKELGEHLLPKPIFKALYAAFWSLAVVATGSRVTQNYKQAPKEDAVKSGAKMLIHDGISAIGMPTIVANLMNFIQNKIYKPLPLPETFKHLVRSIVSLYTCKITIHALDPTAKKISQTITGSKEDRHHHINLALGNQHGSQKDHDSAYSQAA